MPEPESQELKPQKERQLELAVSQCVRNIDSLVKKMQPEYLAELVRGEIEQISKQYEEFEITFESIRDNSAVQDAIFRAVLASGWDKLLMPRSQR